MQFPNESAIQRESSLTDFSLPFRLRLSTFLLYEPYIAQAISKSPETININPAPLRPTTFAARLRDSIISYDKFRWKEASFTSMDFDNTRNSGGLVVAHSDQNVTIGPRKTRKAGQTPGQSVAFNNPDDFRLTGIFVSREIDQNELRAFCTLLGAKLISGPVILEKNAYNEELFNALEAACDIAITTNNRKQIVIL